MAKKACKYEDSIIAGLGWQEQEYKDFCKDYYNFKIYNDRFLDKVELKHYTEISGTESISREDYIKNQIEYWNNKLRGIAE